MRFPLAPTSSVRFLTNDGSASIVLLRLPAPSDGSLTARYFSYESQESTGSLFLLFIQLLPVSLFFGNGMST